MKVQRRQINSYSSTNRADSPTGCASRFHRAQADDTPDDAELIACAHAGGRVLELEIWPDGEYSLHAAGGAEILVWSTSVAGLFKEQFAPLAGFEFERARLFPNGCFVHFAADVQDDRSS